MSVREEQCNKVCRILDDVLANRPTERDSLIVAVRKAFEALELFGNSEPLPSAQPEYRMDEWCTDCKEYDHERHCCPRFNHVIRATLQEVQAERKMGKWTINDCHAAVYKYHCSECGANHRARYDYCPSCGADMRGEQDG